MWKIVGRVVQGIMMKLCLLTSSCAAQFLISTGPRLWGWGPLLYKTPCYQSMCNVEGVVDMSVNTCLAITWRLSMKLLETFGSGCVGVQRRLQVKSEMRTFTQKKLHFMFRVSYLSLLSYTFSPFSKNYKLQEVMDHICVETV